jgi:serine/threonine protein kinase
MKILSLDYSWPSEIVVSDETKDLVERLLKINPMDRLGADQPGGPNDLNLLMKHPYFKDICWPSLEDSVVPLQLPK